jgi:glycosyltransferase involved in cell wall biosynthesis
MKILVLTKRQYMGKDLLDDRFGRFWELPKELARRGHQVHGICMSYRMRSEALDAPEIECETGRLLWRSVNLFGGGLPRIPRCYRLIRKIVDEFRPDLIWACSDAYQIIFGQWLAKRPSKSLFVDLYDNFESYPATKAPGILPLFRRAIGHAVGITCVSERLANYVTDAYQSRAPKLVLENAVRTDLFYPRNRALCRSELGLPQTAKIIGTAGALYASRGIGALFKGFEILASENSNLHLAIAGPRPSAKTIPTGSRIHDLGMIPLETVGQLFNALDVAVVSGRNSAFGQHGFPQKAREIMACGTPLVAADVGVMSDLLRDHRECLFAPNEAASFAAVVRRQLEMPTRIGLNVPSWSDLAVKLESFFAESAAAKHDPR